MDAQGQCSKRGFFAAEVATSLTPPNLELKPDFTFEAPILVETLANGRGIFPKLTFTLSNHPGFAPAVVHIVNQGEELPPGVSENFNQVINKEERVINICKPIEFLQDLYHPTESQEPIQVPPGQ